MHVNISGAEVTASSGNMAAATRLVAFLASPRGGKAYAEGHRPIGHTAA